MHVQIFIQIKIKKNTEECRFGKEEKVTFLTSINQQQISCLDNVNPNNEPTK